MSLATEGINSITKLVEEALMFGLCMRWLRGRRIVGFMFCLMTAAVREVVNKIHGKRKMGSGVRDCRRNTMMDPGFLIYTCAP